MATCVPLLISPSFVSQEAFAARPDSPNGARPMLKEEIDKIAFPKVDFSALFPPKVAQ